MRWSVNYSKMERWIKTVLHTLGISIGVLLMMTVNANSAPTFKLKAAEEYFEDVKSLALLNAALTGNLDMAKQLVAGGADPNAEGPRNNPYNHLGLLHYAIAAKNAKAVRVLIAVGADPEIDPLGSAGRAFLFALNLDSVEMLSLLLDLRPISTLSKDTLQYLLFESVSLPRPRCLDLLLKRGAPIDFPDDVGCTIMMRAMDAQDYDLAEHLILMGASVHIEDKSGLTPAYSVQFHLQKFKPGSPTYNKVLRLKDLMQARGAVFPALSPAEMRARHGKQ
jgi:uncharacterized protein